MTIRNSHHAGTAALDFSRNRAENDHILGDAYEYLKRHFATESGRAKGEFYTPSEVSRIIAKAVGTWPKPNSSSSRRAYRTPNFTSAPSSPSPMA